MKFEYTSIRFGTKKNLPNDIVTELREYLISKGYDRNTEQTLGELQDTLLAFRTSKGTRLQIHQLEPVFRYLGYMGKIWTEK